MLGLSGCGVGKVREAAARQKRMNTLKMIGLAYLSYLDDVKNKGEPPAKAADLQPYLGGDADANAALTDGSFVLNYGLTVKDMQKTGMSQTVLGYDAQSDKERVMVLMCDGSVQVVTPDAFKAMPQASPAAKKP
jgi:prepilin-type processing-associated H-X9-DG protein